jgi:hypothetical protein
LSGTGGEEIPYPSLTGQTTARAKTLILRLSDGSTLSIHPVLAPVSLRRRWPWLGAVRVFSVYYEPGLEPERFLACSHDGRLLASAAASRYHSFDAVVGQGGESNRACPEV